MPRLLLAVIICVTLRQDQTPEVSMKPPEGKKDAAPACVHVKCVCECRKTVARADSHPGLG